MTTDELKYRLEARHWWVDRWGRYTKFDTVVQFKGRCQELLEVRRRSEFGQWVIIAREYVRLVRPTKRNELQVGKYTIKW